MGFPPATGPGRAGFVGSRNPGQAQMEPLCMLELPLGAALGGPVQGPNELVPCNLSGPNLTRAC